MRRPGTTRPVTGRDQGGSLAQGVSQFHSCPVTMTRTRPARRCPLSVVEGDTVGAAGAWGRSDWAIREGAAALPSTRRAAARARRRAPIRRSAVSPERFVSIMTGVPPSSRFEPTERERH
jgi:hypothetical protein